MAQENSGPRHGGSVTLPKGADEKAIDAALRGPAKKPAAPADKGDK